MEAAQSAATAADTANSNSQATLSALQTDSATLPAKLMQAQQDLSAAQATLDQQRVLAADNAQDEAQAFGAFRTTQPFLIAYPLVTSADPAKRVLLYAYPDSKTLYLRGLPDDVRKTEAMVASSTTPSPRPASPSGPSK